MGMLHYVCPTACYGVDSGIGLDKTTFETARLKVVRVNCPACNKQHCFLMADGWLEDGDPRVLH